MGLDDEIKEEVKEVAEDAAKLVLRPRPGLAICSFWGGRVEIIMRIVAAVVSC